MEQPRRKQRPRPSIFVLVMLLAGALASVASSPPSSSAETAGSIIVSPQSPAAQVTIASGGGPELSSPDLNLRWTATSESGVEPELSVTSLGSEMASTTEVPVSAVDIDARNADIEFTVRNIEETGPVTIEWQATTSMKGSDLDLSITASASLGQPSSAVTLPVIRSPFRRLRVPFTVFVVEAKYESSGTVTIERTDQNRDVEIEVEAIVGESLLAVEPGNTSIPTDGAECVGDQCVLTVTLAAAEMPTLHVEVGGTAGSVTAVARQPESEVAWVEVTPLRLLSEVSDLSIDVKMPHDPGNPFADRAVLVARISDSDRIVGDLNCFAPVEYAVAEEPYAEAVSFVSNEPGGRPLTLIGGATTTVDLRLGTTDPGQYCDVGSDHESAVEIGVMTIGVSDVLPAMVSLR